MSRYQEGFLVRRFGGWHVRYYTHEDGTRKQKSHRLCDDRQKMSVVKQKRNDFMREVNAQAGQSTGPMSVVDFWDAVYLPFIESNNNFKPATVYGYKQVWNAEKHGLKSHFGATALKDYKTPMMTNFLTGLAKTLRPRTLDRFKWLASSIFAHAVATGQCESNPIRDARVLGNTLGNGDTKSYTLEEIENVISVLVDRVDAQLVMALSWFAGLRKGEIQGLQWNDIDANLIHVRRAFSRGEVGPPKSKKAIRSIPIIQPVKSLLLLWRAKHPDGVWVFQNTEGGALNMDQFAREVLRPALKKAGIEWKGFHAGRRGLGAELRLETGDSTAGRDALGHATTRVTEDSYEPRLPEGLLQAMKQLESKAKSLGK